MERGAEMERGPEMERGSKMGLGGVAQKRSKEGGSQKRNSREPEVKPGVQRCIDVSSRT